VSILLSILVAAAVATDGSSPGDPDSELTLARALELSAAASPRTARIRAQIGEAQSDVVAAKVAPNPSLDYTGSRLRSGTNTGASVVDTVGAEWPLLIFGQRGARIRAAKAGLAAAETRVEADLSARAHDVRSAFDDLLSQQERTRLLEEARSDLERVSKIVSGRKNAGEASDYESLRVETEFRAMDAELGDARGDLADARGRLAVLLGRPGTTPHAVGNLVLEGTTPLDADALWAIASQRLPALLAAREDEKAAGEALDAARRDAYPVPVLSGGVALTQDAQSRSATFGVSIPLPILDRNQGAVAKAQARSDEAALERHRSRGPRRYRARRRGRNEAPRGLGGARHGRLVAAP
jgi:cobalt-zinc-cadmium efflux system outer membrane protein